jgi:hypothetical protein
MFLSKRKYGVYYINYKGELSGMMKKISTKVTLIISQRPAFSLTHGYIFYESMRFI